jgi:hypothetical protein
MFPSRKMFFALTAPLLLFWYGLRPMPQVGMENVAGRKACFRDRKPLGLLGTGME